DAGILPNLIRVRNLEVWPDAEKRRLVLLQYINLLAVANMAGFVVLYLVAGAETLGVPLVTTVACIPCYLGAWFLNRRGHPLASKLTLCTVLSGSIFLATAVYFGRAPGLHFFLLLAAVIPLLLWPLNRPLGIGIFMGGSLAGFLFVQLRTDETGLLVPHFPQGWVPFFNAFAVVAVYAVTVMILALLQRRTETDSLSLEEKAKELEHLLHQFERLSYTDPLTGLNNRRAMLLKMEEERGRMTRNHSVFSLILGDIDLFKSINDEYGHEAGDVVLVGIATEFREALREVDPVARWGGEEFLILLPDTAGEGALVVGERLRQRVEAARFPWRGRELRCTMTLGIAVHTPVSRDLLETIRRADAALYEGKHRGRNRVVLAPPGEATWLPGTPTRQ
ncbi:MAG TPA: GGDEF domain-containing protein, partial [Spirochaetia bacterium]|nr:GGDEF domain-containing protein [Spirochaetia bacterium]